MASTKYPCALLLALCVACGSGSRETTAPTAATGTAGRILINGAGATFPYPIYSKWFDEFHRLHPDLQFNYQSIGSGGGIRQLLAGTVDFGASDSPMTDEQLAQAPTKVLHFPTVLGAVVPTYNLAGVTGEITFTPEALAGIFQGKIKRWNAPALTQANPKVKLPAADIVVVHRSDGSGTTFVWTDYLSKVSAGLEKDGWSGKFGKLAGRARRQRQRGRRRTGEADA